MKFRELPSLCLRAIVTKSTGIVSFLVLRLFKTFQKFGITSDQTAAALCIYFKMFYTPVEMSYTRVEMSYTRVEMLTISDKCS
jgi:hypothetical protein